MTLHRSITATSGVKRAALALALIAATGCNEIIASLFVGGVGAQRLSESEQQRARWMAPCNVRACPANQHCNDLLTPPRCAPTLGTEAMPCGTARNDPNRFFQCLDPLVCVGPVTGTRTCVPKAREGQPCVAMIMGERPTCDDGLVCGPDQVCRQRAAP